MERGAPKQQCRVGALLDAVRGHFSGHTSPLRGGGHCHPGGVPNRVEGLRPPAAWAGHGLASEPKTRLKHSIPRRSSKAENISRRQRRGSFFC